MSSRQCLPASQHVNLRECQGRHAAPREGSNRDHVAEMLTSCRTQRAESRRRRRAYNGRHMDYVTIQHEDDVSVLIIDRQEKLNALDRQVVEEIGQALLELESEGPRAIIVTGAGERAFIAGADIG